MNILNLLKPSVFYFYFKQAILLCKHKNRLHISGYRLSYENGADIYIDQNAQINLGHTAYLKKGVDIEAHDNAHITIGKNFFLNKNSSIIARYGITIGDDCMIGECVTISDHNHSFDNLEKPFKDQGYHGNKILIGNNVWIAGRVFIGQGVEIGDNVVIGANTIVTKSIPANSVVYGQTKLIIRQNHVTE